MVELREVTNKARKQIFTDYEEKGVLTALAQGVGCPVMEGFKVKAYNADSSAVVFDMTDFFFSGGITNVWILLTRMVRRRCTGLVLVGLLLKRICHILIN